MKRTKIAVIGAGDISGIYLENLTKLFRQVEVVGIYSKTEARARAQAEKFGIPKVYATLPELLSDPETEIVLNLTPPQEHFALGMRCLEAGKHVYTEKALTATLEEGRTLVDEARKRGLSLCGAPDLFLGAGPQTLRKLVDDGFIGRVTGVSVSILNGGQESWHANPAFFYKQGGGPMLDVGVYPLTALVNVLGPVQAVAGMCSKAFEQRTVATQPHFGEIIQVETPTNIAGLLRFRSGVIGTIATSFDACAKAPASMEIAGTRGMLKASPFGGPVSMLQPEDGQFRELPLLFAYRDKIHGLGLVDQACAIGKGRAPRASGELMLHVLEVMTAFERSSDSGAFVTIQSTVERPEPMAVPALPYVMD